MVSSCPMSNRIGGEGGEPGAVQLVAACLPSDRDQSISGRLRSPPVASLEELPDQPEAPLSTQPAFVARASRARHIPENS
jgi:hypothetical protein